MTQQYIVEQYTFDAAAKTIRMPQVPNLSLAGVQLITNLTDGVIIYQFNNVAKGGSVTGDTLTLTYDTTSMSSTDILQILYNPPRGGFFDRMQALLYQIVEILRAPEWKRFVNGQVYQAAFLDNNSSINNVSAVASVNAVTNLTNFNTVDSRELIWSMWDTEYNTGIRNKIT